MQILESWKQLSSANIDFLHNAVKIRAVAIAEALAVNQIKGVFEELDRYGLNLEQIIVNNLVTSDGSDFMARRAVQQKRYLQLIREITTGLPLVEVPLFPEEIKGMEMLRRFEKHLIFT